MRFSELRRTLISLVLLWTSYSLHAESMLFATYELKPYVTYAHGQFSGEMVVKIRELCRAAKVRCFFELLPRQHAEWLVRRGKVDGIFPIEWNQERAAAMVFSKPLMSVEYGLYEKNAGRVNDSNRMGLKRIGAEEESTDFYFAKVWSDKRIQDYQLKPFISLDVAFYALHQGYIDKVYANKGAANWWLNNMSYKNIGFTSSDKILRYHLAFGTRRVNPEMAQRFDRAYWALVRTGALHKVT